jgi:hypothetical protein
MQNEPFDQLDQQPNPQPKMPLGKAVLFNFLFMLAYMAIAVVSTPQGHDASLSLMALNAFLVVAQVGLNLLLGLILLFSPKQKHLGSALLISGLIMGAIGFGSCIGAIALYEM